MDLDSPLKSRFTEEDRAGLEIFAQIIEDSLPADFPARLM